MSDDDDRDDEEEEDDDDEEEAPKRRPAASDDDDDDDDDEKDDDEEDEGDELKEDDLKRKREGEDGGGGGQESEEEEPEEAEEEGEVDDPAEMFSELPIDVKGLRACKKCRLVKNFQQFVDNGCDNCRQFEDQEEAADYTSPHFTGMMALVHPNESWAAKWQSSTAFRPGLYALQVEGENEFVDDMEQ